MPQLGSGGHFKSSHKKRTAARFVQQSRRKKRLSARGKLTGYRCIHRPAPCSCCARRRTCRTCCRCRCGRPRAGVDAAIVGQTLGSKALAAVGASSSVQFLILGFCMGICQGFAIMVSQSFGAKRFDEMHTYIYAGAVWTAITAFVVSILVVVFCADILHILQVNDEIFKDAYAYLVVIFAGIPFTLLYNYLSAILRAIGDSKTPFLFLAFSAVLNIGLDFFCILVLKWGCAGAAIATIFAQAVSGILCLLLIAFKVNVLHIPKSSRYVDKNHSIKLLAMGVPMGLQFSITAIGSMVMQSANNALGTIYVSGFTAGMRIKSLISKSVNF